MDSWERGRPARPHEGWHSRGYLPHSDQPGLVRSITFRLHDAVPQAVLNGWREELGWQHRLAADDLRAVELRKRVERYEDAGHGACWLGRDDVAQIVEEALLHFDGERYRLLAWSIMPNHVHVLCECREGHSLSAIVHSWESFTSKMANRMLGRSGQFWMEEYHDRFIRDEEHLAAAKRYIEENPVEAGLVETVGAWRWGSAWEGRQRRVDEAREAGETPAFPWDGAVEPLEHRT